MDRREVLQWIPPVQVEDDDGRRAGAQVDNDDLRFAFECEILPMMKSLDLWWSVDADGYIEMKSMSNQHIHNAIHFIETKGQHLTPLIPNLRRVLRERTQDEFEKLANL